MSNGKQAAAALIDLLQGQGYFQYYLLLGDGNLRGWDWSNIGKQLEGDGKAIWDFLLCSEQAASADIKKLFGNEIFDWLQDRGVMEEKGDQCSLGKKSLVSYQGRCFFIDRQLGSGCYFGEDTKALMSLLPQVGEGDRFLRMHGGCGVELLALLEKRAVGGVLDPGTDSRLLSANLELNGFKAEGLIIEDGGEATPCRAILASIPSYPAPAPWNLPDLMAGGEDGREQLGITLDLSGKRLTDNGSLYFTTLLFAGNVPKLKEEMNEVLEAHALRGDVSIVGKGYLKPGAPAFNQLIAGEKHQCDRDVAEVVDEAVSHLEKLGYEAAYLIKGRCRRSEIGKHHWIDFSEAYYGGWTF